MASLQRALQKAGLDNVASIAGALVLVTIFHWNMANAHPLLHEVSQRLYYLPIVYAAYRYGLRGGLATAFASALLFIPHLYLHLNDAETFRNQVAELIMFTLVGAVTGSLSALQKREHRRYIETAEKLQKAYDELKETTDQLLQADRLASLGQLSAVLAHEIRNPLASIKGSVEVLESEIPRGHVKREFLEIITSESDRLSKLVNEFLQFARPPRPEVAPVQPNDVARSVSALIAKQAARAGIHLLMRLDDTLPEVMMDAEQIKQALLNIVINAMQAMPDGGRLEVTTAPSKTGIAFRIADSGPGIPVEVRQRLFNPFVTTKTGGTGLGLAIAYRLVKQHQGTIRAGEAPGGGSIFEIELPVGGDGGSSRLPLALVSGQR